MDRQIIFPGAIPLETDLLATNKNAMMGLSKLAAAMFGTGNFVNGLSCGPNSPAALNVIVAPGEIYSLQNVDGTAYSSLAADTAHQVLKQGILMDAVTLACAAPGTAGQSINYLVQAAFAETDVNAVVLPYYNASNPSVAWSGPSNSGTAQFTNRQDQCVLSVVAGAAATTGTQTTPNPSAGAVGLCVVTVAQGQTTIVAGNITQYSGAALVPAGGAVSNAMNAILNKSVAGAANVALDPNGEAAYPIINLTGALTGNINVITPASSRQWIVSNNTSGAFAVTVKTAAGTGIVVPQGAAKVLYCDGTNVQDAISGFATQAQFDSTTKAATTAFVQGALGSASGFATISANITLAATHAGKACYFSAAAIATLPLANTVPAGTFIYFAGFTSGSTSISRQGGDTIAASSGSSVLTSMVLLDGEDLILESNGNTQWVAVGGSARLKYAGGFGSSLAAGGYQKLPSGLIIQWMTQAITATPTNYNFPIAFPIGCKAISSSTQTAASQCAAAPVSTTQFSATTASGTTSATFIFIGN